METLKVLKSRMNSRMVRGLELSREKREKRANFDITQYFEDTQRSYMQAIQVIVASKTGTYYNRSNVGGRHEQMEQMALSREDEVKLSTMEGYYADLMARECGLLVIEMTPPLNSGICPIFYPEDINDHQLDVLQDFCDKMTAYNESCDDDFYTFSVAIRDPETNDETNDLQSVIDKLKGRVKAR